MRQVKQLPVSSQRLYLVILSPNIVEVAGLRGGPDETRMLPIESRP